MSIKRRTLIKSLVVGGITVSTLTYLNWSDEAPDQGFKNWLKTVVSNEQIADAMNQFNQPFEVLEEQLGSQIKSSDNDINEAVKQAIKSDFEHENWVVIDDWYLSETEALILAAAIQIYGISQVVEEEQTFANAPFEDFITIENWGPQETFQGVKFNEQPDGHCGMWIVSQQIPDGVEVYIGGNKTRSFTNENGLTTGIYNNVDQFINRVGTTEIVIYDIINHRKQKVGDFTVLPAFDYHQYPDGTPSQVFGKLKGWGPQSSRLGEVFNVQPNGSAAFWFKINSMKSQVQLKFNQTLHKTTVRTDLITSAIDPQFIPKQPGLYPIHLISKEDNEELLLGHFEVI